MGNYGPDGLIAAAQPGWHAKTPPDFPESIVVDFRVRRQVGRVGLLPQDNSDTRAPKAIRIEISDDGEAWTQAAHAGDMCAARAPDGWSNIDFSERASGRYLKIVILSNCGDPALLTLRGLRFD